VSGKKKRAQGSGPRTPNASSPKSDAASPKPEAGGRKPDARGRSAWDRFFFAARDPRMCSVIRIGYSALLLINLVLWASHLELWFGDSGLLPSEAARHVAGVPSLVAYLPVWMCMGLLMAHTIALAAGFYPRVQALFVLFWLTQFDNRNVAIIDGEDTVLRLFAFYLALCPPPNAKDAVPWALRLFQIQIAVIYLSSAIEKTWGHDWTNGHALYYTARLDDWFGKLPVPAFITDSTLPTYGVLAMEWLLPILLFVPRTRKWAVAVGIAFHLSIEWTMNLFLFHWIMILGLLSFLEYGELVSLRDRVRTFIGRPRRDPDPAR